MMTSVLLTPDGKTVETEAAIAPSPATIASTSGVERPRPTRSLRSSPGPAGCVTAAPSDNTPEVVRFAENPEKVRIDTVQAGDMTRDLAILIRADSSMGDDQPVPR
jgi:isocitrate dehydrogenase